MFHAANILGWRLFCPLLWRKVVKVSTTRFGELNVEKEDILTFTEGILGFEHLKKFFIVDPGDNSLILWLQSVDDAPVAFPIIEPKIFRPDYSVKLSPLEMAGLGLENLNDAKIYSILTIPKDITLMSANIKAPLVINNRNKTARQIVLQDSKLSVKHEMYKDLKQYIVKYSSDDSRRTTVASPHSTSAREEMADAVSSNSAPVINRNSPEKGQ